MPLPDSLRKFLEGLPDQESLDLWLWLDGTPTAIEDMIMVICDSHTGAVIADTYVDAATKTGMYDRDF